MGKLRQWFRKWLDRQIEKSLQRQANRIFKRGLKRRKCTMAEIFLILIWIALFLLDTDDGEKK